MELESPRVTDGSRHGLSSRLALWPAVCPAFPEGLPFRVPVDKNEGAFERDFAGAVCFSPRVRQSGGR